MDRTPNMHLHCHIVDSIKDFGPAHAFWCYAFERYNGILESVHTNKEIQIKNHSY